MKASLKPLFYLAGTIFIFAIFIYLLLKPSTQSKAIKEIETCLNSDDVKSVWDKYRLELSGDEDYHQTVRNKLQTFNLSQKELPDIKKWLPPRTQNLNIILVPDLSGRIKDEKNNPEQVKNDTALLNTIWGIFEKNVRLKINSKDRLVVDIADPRQGQGQFKTIADELVFDLSECKGKSNRLYFNAVEGKFGEHIAQLYDLAIPHPTGANYVYFFSDKLPSLLKKSTLDDDYRNIVILLTDGYLEITKEDKIISVTPPTPNLKAYCKSLNNSSFIYPVQTIDMAFPDIEVYLFEVNERQRGEGCDFRGLKKWWSDWFKSMKVINADEEFIFRRQEAINLTKNELQTIFDRK